MLSVPVELTSHITITYDFICHIILNRINHAYQLEAVLYEVLFILWSTFVEEIGNSILDDLHTQRETLQKSRDRVGAK